MSDVQRDPAERKMADAREEPKMPGTSAAELLKLRADNREQAEKLRKLESIVDNKIEVATFLAKHLKENIERDISQQRDAMESLAATTDAVENMARSTLRTLGPRTPRKPFVMPKFPEFNFTEDVFVQMQKKISELEALIKQLAKAAGVAIDETKDDLEYTTEVVRQTTEEILRMKENLASINAN